MKGRVEFSDLAAKYKPLNLGMGCPDFAVAPTYAPGILATIATDAQSPHLNQYTRGAGHPRLVNILSTFYSKLVERHIDPEKEILVTYGASAAIYVVLMALVNPGDEVIIIEPFFDLYLPLVEQVGAIPVCVPLRPQVKDDDGAPMCSSDWKLDEEELTNSFNVKTKMIIVNTPNNPLGKVFTRQELELIGGLAQVHDVLLLMDEVYEMITYSGLPHIRMASLPGMWDRTITVSSAGKIFSLTGWKLGWAYGPKNLMQEVQRMNTVVAFSCPTPIQEAVAVSLEVETERLGQSDSYWIHLSNLLQTKRDFMCSKLIQAQMQPVIPDGSYFILADFSKLESMVTDEEYDKPRDYRFAKWLCTQKGLQGIPFSPFYSEEHQHLADHYIRFCFIKDSKTLEKAEQILSELNFLENSET